MSKSLINHVWRNSNSWAKVNHVWRNYNDWAKVNHIWRRNADSKPILKAEDIVGFHVIYTPNKFIRYKLFPNMGYNERISIIVDRTGYVDNSLYDEKKKSIIFEYSNAHPELEGTYVFDGNIYAELKSGEMICISSYTDHASTYDPGDISVKIFGQSSAETYGPVCLGWNMMFTRNNNLADDIPEHKNVDGFNSYHILPSYKRDENYCPIATIGIARNMTDRYNNMVGSQGALDQTIDKILLNDQQMPFRITIYKD